MKKLFVFLLVLFLFIGNGCASTKDNFHKRKYHSESKRDYTEKRGLMLLDNTHLGINKYFYSKNNQKRIHKRKK